MVLTMAEAEDLFQSPFKPETHTISFERLEVDFLEEGLRLTMREAMTSAHKVRAGDFVSLGAPVSDPAQTRDTACAKLGTDVPAHPLVGNRD